jgi:hypothetical protein
VKPIIDAQNARLTATVEQPPNEGFLAGEADPEDESPGSQRAESGPFFSRAHLLIYIL